MRIAMLITGVLALATTWGLLPLFAPKAFFVHMLMHMGVVAIAAPLLAIGIAGGRLDPVAKAPRFFAPIPISVAELVVVWAWHAPRLHHVARHTLAGLFAEQSMFLVCGLLLWLSAFGGNPCDKDRAAAGVIGLLLTMMHMVLLGALLALTTRPLYAHATSHFELTPLEDQQLGGAIMLVGGGVSYLIGGLSLTARLLTGYRSEMGERR